MGVFDTYDKQKGAAPPSTSAPQPTAPQPGGGSVFSNYPGSGTTAPASTVVAPATSTSGGQSAQPGWTDYLLQHLAGPLWDPNAKKTLGTTALWDKPADVSWGDYAQAHLQPLDDTVRSAANAFGGDRFAAMMDRLTGTGPKLSELVTQSATGQPTDMLSIERARSAAAAQRDPSATAAGDVLGGAMIGGPIGEAAQGLRAAPYISKLPGWLASRVAGGTVGAGSSALGAYGRGDDITMPTLVGGAIGAVIGAPSGTPGPLARSVEEARNAESSAYFPTHSIKFPMNQISDAYHDAQGALTKDQEAGLSPGFRSTLAQHIEENEKTATTSASEIDGFQRGLNEAAKTKADGVLANSISENLDNVLQNVKPVIGNPTSTTVPSGTVRVYHGAGTGTSPSEYGDSGAWVSSSPTYAKNWGSGNKTVYYTDVPTNELPSGVAEQHELNGVIPNFQLSPRQTAGLKAFTRPGDPDPNFATGEAADLLAKAKLAASRRMNAQGIAEARRVGGLPGESVGETGSGWARGELKTNPQFYTDPDVNAAMRSVAGAGSWLPPSYLFKHALAYPVAGALIGGGHRLATGGDNPWWKAGQEALEYGGAGIAAGYGIPAVRSGLVSRAMTQAAPTLTAGAPFPPPSFLDEIRRLMYGRLAAGFQR